MAKLNNTVPSFSTNVGKFSLRFPNQKRVQKPLQDVYNLFINAHFFLIDEFTKVDPGELSLPFRREMVAIIDPM